MRGLLGFLGLRESWMATEIAQEFRRELGVLQAMLLGLQPELADTPWRAGGWTRKQIVGHLLDSAANNRQRFVRAAADGRYAGPKYAQDAWVAAHGYAEQDWETLLRWWQAEHEILAAVVDRIPEERLRSQCVVGENEPVTLRFLIEDYLEHQQWHFAQLTGEAAK
jgi:DinB superfamily